MIATATFSKSGGGSSTVLLSDSELQLFQEVMYREAGIRLPDAKRSLIQARLQERLLQLNCRSF